MTTRKDSKLKVFDQDIRLDSRSDPWLGSGTKAAGGSIPPGGFSSIFLSLGRVVFYCLKV